MMDSVNGLVSTFEIFFKWLLVLGVLVYIAYALIAIRQVGLMTDSYNTPREDFVKWLARFNFGLALLVLVIVLVVL